jgi:hypothetical protein
VNVPRRFETVEAATEQDARDIAERRVRDAGYDVIRVEAADDLDPELLPEPHTFVVWVSVR